MTTSEGQIEPGALLGAAAEHATLRVPTATAADLAGEVRRHMVGSDYESAAEVVVLVDGRLAGLVAMERLLAAGADRPLSELMDAEPPVVSPATDQERAAHRMIEHGQSSLALVDDRGHFEGLVPARQMLRVLLGEHEEDMARLGGYLAGSRRARGAAEEPIGRRLVHRLPWLLIGLLGAMISAVLVGAFESELEANVLLAFFGPGLVYMADAVGTQTETVLIRAMAAGVSVRSVLRRELATGLIVGLIMGAAFIVFALIGWGDVEVAVTVGLALLASCSIATLVAMTLPAVIQRFGRDPAFGSGPLATVIQDLLSIVVYFAIVVWLVG
jgi:magnesium transporter